MLVAIRRGKPACACFGPFLLQAWIPLDPRHFSASYGAILILLGLVNIPTTKEQHINQLQEFRERMLHFCAEYRYVGIIYHHYAGPVLPEAINTVLDSLDVKKGSFGEKLDIYCLSKSEKK